MPRLSARFLLTLLMTGMTTLVVILVAAVVRQLLQGPYEGLIEDANGAIWTVGLLLITTTALATWALASLLLHPLAEMRRNLRLAARIRALAEPQPAEVAEIHALRTAMLAVLEDLDVRTRLSEAEQYRILGM